MLGPEQGIAVVEHWLGAEALLLDEDGSMWQTCGWLDATHFEPIARGIALDRVR